MFLDPNKLQGEGSFSSSQLEIKFGFNIIKFGFNVLNHHRVESVRWFLNAQQIISSE